MEYFRLPLNLPYDLSLGLENQHPSISQGINFYLRNLFNGSFFRMIQDYDIYHLHHCAFVLPRQMGIDIQLVRLLNSARLSKKNSYLFSNWHHIENKPITIEAHKAYELVEISANNGLILQVGHICRFVNVIEKLMESIVD